MIGVVAEPSDHDVVREFFELFKTPWELFRSDRRYDAVLCTAGVDFREANTGLVLIYAGAKIPFDQEAKIQVDSQRTNATLSYTRRRIPIYGRGLIFQGEGIGLSIDDDSQQAAAVCVSHADGRVFVRIGYDLFGEIRSLLTVGQPFLNADMPALELHIAFLRDLIVRCGVPLVEIPPVPDGYRFIACLTHDVDHPAIRHHKWDHTMWGFLYRACVGSFIDVCRGRAPLRHLLTNWAAAWRLPLVHVGLAKDFWYGFDRYLDMEQGLASTFFVIPTKEYPGRTVQGEAPAVRASRYEPRDIAGRLEELMTAGREIGVHGLDAWLDSVTGREELKEVSRITGAVDVGIRMHWLYFDERSPVALEKAGYAYDSTVGYNETVGYRAGTTQAFKPLGTRRLLELPLHVMDTALFYPNYLNLSARAARERVSSIIDNAVRFGGTVTVNWHDRSIAPERLWGDCYVSLVDELKRKEAWFPTASQAVSWFRKRRSAVFERISWEGDTLHAKIECEAAEELPGLRLRIHNAQASRDIGLKHSLDTRIRL
jgi:hypothetical protein